MNARIGFLTIGILILGFTGAYLVYSGFKNASVDGTKACLLSIEFPLVYAIESENLESNLRLTEDWQVINDQSLNNLISITLSSGKTDCSTIRDISKGWDFWGSRISVAARKDSDMKVFVRISSPGPDMATGTDDDISVESK